jgi:hypothetical protein
MPADRVESEIRRIVRSPSFLAKMAKNRPRDFGYQLRENARRGRSDGYFGSKRTHRDLQKAYCQDL